MIPHIADWVRTLRGGLLPGLWNPADGVALRSVAHPIGPLVPDDHELGGIITSEIELTPYARAGEQVTCENNHLICEFEVDVHVGQTQDLANQLGGWRQKEPEIGAMEMPVCVACGGAFYQAGGVFHFRDGWRGFGRGLRISRSR